MLPSPAHISVSVLPLKNLILDHEGWILAAGILTNANTVTNVIFAFLMCMFILGKSNIIGENIEINSVNSLNNHSLILLKRKVPQV